MTVGPSTPHEPWRPRARRTIAVAATVALLLLAGSTLLVLSWRSDLPDPIASNWGADSAPNGFMSLNQWVTIVLLSGVALVALFCAVGWFWGSTAWSRRAAAGITVWIGGLFAVTQAATIGGQRGLADAAQARESGAWLLAAYLLPLLPAIVVAATVPGDPRRSAAAPVPPDAEHAPLPDGDNTVWLRRVSGGVGPWIAALIAVLMIATATFSRQWALLAIPVLLVMVAVPMGAIDVRVDATGLRVRSGLGWPRVFVPADEVVRARVVEVAAFRQFGGWGWRPRRNGSLGVVPRSGPGIEVERTGGRTLTVTLDDATTGAALLNALVDRTR